MFNPRSWHFLPVLYSTSFFSPTNLSTCVLNFFQGMVLCGCAITSALTGPVVTVTHCTEMEIFTERLLTSLPAGLLAALPSLTTNCSRAS